MKNTIGQPIFDVGFDPDNRYLSVGPDGIGFRIAGSKWDSEKQSPCGCQYPG